MYRIRPFNPIDAEYETLVTINNANWPDDPSVVENWKWHDEKWDHKFLHQRFVAEAVADSRVADNTGKIIAYGGCNESPWSYVAGKYGVHFEVHPDYANQGIEEQLYEHLIAFLADRDPTPTIYTTGIREDKTDRAQFLEAHGYKMVMREPVSEIDLTDYDYTPFAQAEPKARSHGIEFYTLPELQARFDDWMPRSYDLIVAIIDDVPMMDEQTPRGLEEFAKDFDHPSFLPDAQFYALDGDEWVGLSTLGKDLARADKLGVEITGVLRSHRRKRIATALKLMTFRYAQEHGARYLETGNEEKNPMYDLNLALGFKPKPAWLSYRKELME